MPHPKILAAAAILLAVFVTSVAFLARSLVGDRADNVAPAVRTRCRAARGWLIDGYQSNGRVVLCVVPPAAP